MGRLDDLDVIPLLPSVLFDQDQSTTGKNGPTDQGRWLTTPWACHDASADDAAAQIPGDTVLVVRLDRAGPWLHH